MNKLKSLSKLAIAAVAGVSATTMLEVTSAQAFQLPLSDALNCGITEDCSLGDKVITNVGIGGDLNLATYGNAVFELEQNPADPLDYEVVLDFGPNESDTTPAFFTGTGELTYTISVTDPNLGLIATGVDSDVFGILDGGTTSVEKSGTGFTAITSENGSNVGTGISPIQMSIDITDEISTVDPGAINEFSNEFLQGPKPDPEPVPEPGTILGLLAVGGLGLGLKRKKQS